MKVLVFGVSGMLGHKIWEVLNMALPNQVYGTIRKKKSELERFGFFQTKNIFEGIEADNSQQVLDLLQRVAPDVIVNCTGITLRKEDNSSYEKNLKINAFFPQLLSLWASNNKARLIHFSTDCVFDGQAGDYTEVDYPTAFDTYGVCKYLGEVKAEGSLTLRVSIVGRELFNKTELIEWFLSKKGKAVSGYANVFYTGLTTDFLARELVRVIKDFPRLSGLYNVSSQKISKYELLKLLNSIFENNTEIAKDETKRADKSLNCEKYVKETGFVKPNWPDMIADLRKNNLNYERV